MERVYLQEKMFCLWTVFSGEKSDRSDQHSSMKLSPLSYVLLCTEYHMSTNQKNLLPIVVATSFFSARKFNRFFDSSIGKKDYKEGLTEDTAQKQTDNIPCVQSFYIISVENDFPKIN